MHLAVTLKDDWHECLETGVHVIVRDQRDNDPCGKVHQDVCLNHQNKNTVIATVYVELTGHALEHAVFGQQNTVFFDKLVISFKRSFVFIFP